MSAEPPTERCAEGPLSPLRRLTAARVGLGRVGHSLPTRAVLEFQLAHARARDAVFSELDADRIRRDLDEPAYEVSSAAHSRLDYLRDPGLGRQVGAGLEGVAAGGYDLAVVIADGLSATAVNIYGASLAKRLRAELPGWRFAPVVIARQGRVALGDEIGEHLAAAAVVVLIGERPGLTANDSLGAYLTWDPKRGRRDSERNCVSNIRHGGLSIEAAASKIGWLLREARSLGRTGVSLKDRQPLAASGLEPPAARLPAGR